LGHLLRPPRPYPPPPPPPVTSPRSAPPRPTPHHHATATIRTHIPQLLLFLGAAALKVTGRVTSPLPKVQKQSHTTTIWRRWRGLLGRGGGSLYRQCPAKRHCRRFQCYRTRRAMQFEYQTDQLLINKFVYWDGADRFASRRASVHSLPGSATKGPPDKQTRARTVSTSRLNRANGSVLYDANGNVPKDFRRSLLVRKSQAAAPPEGGLKDGDRGTEPSSASSKQTGFASAGPLRSPSYVTATRSRPINPPAPRTLSPLPSSPAPTPSPRTKTPARAFFPSPPSTPTRNYPPSMGSSQNDPPSPTVSSQQKTKNYPPSSGSSQLHTNSSSPSLKVASQHTKNYPSSPSVSSAGTSSPTIDRDRWFEAEPLKTPPHVRAGFVSRSRGADAQPSNINESPTERNVSQSKERFLSRSTEVYAQPNKTPPPHNTDFPLTPPPRKPPQTRAEFFGSTDTKSPSPSPSVTVPVLTSSPPSRRQGPAVPPKPSFSPSTPPHPRATSVEITYQPSVNSARRPPAPKSTPAARGPAKTTVSLGKRVF